MLASCQSDRCIIRGEAPALKDGAVLYLTHDLNAAGRPYDSITVSNGHFRHESTVDTPCIARLYAGANPQQAVIFFHEPGNVYIELSERKARSRVSGTVANNRWQALNDSVALYDRRIRRTVSLATDSIGPRELNARMQHIYDSLTRLIQETARQNKDNILGRFIITHYSAQPE